MKKIRAFYRKTGNLKYISHLDMNRFMNRLIRMARLPVLYTEGFNPHPYVNFALPLSLGFESTYECVDFKVEDDADLSAIEAGMKTFSPPGLEVFKVADAVHKSGDIAAARFTVTLHCADDKTAENIKAFLSVDSITVEKTTKKGGAKTIDIAPQLSDIEFEYSENTLKISLTLPAGSENNISPSLLIGVIKEAIPETSLIGVTRTMLYISGGREFK